MTNTAINARGISLYQVGNIDTANIKNNEVVKSPSYGIYIAQLTDGSYKNSVKNVLCTDNILVDCGCNTNLPSVKRAAVFVGGKIEQSVIDKNTIKDTGTTSLNGYYSVYATSSEAYVDTVLSKQTVITSSKTKLSYLVSVPSFVPPVSAQKIVTVSSYPPPDGTTVFEGDMVVVTGATTGQVTSYFCTSKGTFGTLTGVAASMTASKNDITITGSVNTETVLAIDKAGASNTYPTVGTLTYLSNGVGNLSTLAQYTVTNAAVTYWQPTMVAMSYKGGIATKTYDPPSLATATQQSTTITLIGAVIGNTVVVGFDQSLQGTRLWAEVTSANTITVYHRNDTGATVDLPSGTLTVKII